MSGQLRVAAIIPAAGSGKRLQTQLNQSKQFAMLRDKPLLAHTLLHFQECGLIDTLVVPTQKDYISTLLNEVIRPYGISGNYKVIAGGATRQDSVWQGMEALREEAPDIVVVHDAARMFVTPDLIRESIEVAKEHGGAVVGVPAVDTIKMSHSTRIEATVDRSVLWYAQTPQTFQYELLYRAFQTAHSTGFVGTDEAMLVENLGEPVMLVQGSKLNIKITDPDDLKMALALLDYRERSDE